MEFMDLHKTLEKYHQTHLLNFIDELDEVNRKKYLGTLEAIDYELVKNAYENRDVQISRQNIFEPIQRTQLSESEKKQFYKMGLETIKKREVACFLVAGGQGSRLGFEGPKGMYDIGLPSHKSIFQIHVEKLINLHHKTGVYIPLYIMTSHENHTDTVQFFERNQFFGYQKNHIYFFKQSALPAFDLEGKILLKNKNEVNFSPDGNGGCFQAFKKSGYLSQLMSEQYKWIFLFGVDNTLCKVCDPVFIGYAVYHQIKGYSKIVRKSDPNEKVGILCKKNGRPSIVEYSELSDDLRNLRDSKNELIYSNGNILNHVLDIRFLEEVTSIQMPLHLAFKKIEAIDENGNKIKLERENGYKIEYFLFDAFEKLDEMRALEVKREEEFAPVKNKEGSDSPETARTLILNLHQKWLKSFKVRENYELSFREVFDEYDVNAEKLQNLLKNAKKF